MIEYKMLNQFGRFVALNKSSFEMELDYSPEFNDYFDDNQLPKMNKRAIRTAGGLGLFVAGANAYLSVYGILRKVKQAINLKLPKAAGKYFFEAIIIKNRLDPSWFMLHSVSLIESATPECLARQLYGCQSGRKRCFELIPKNKNQSYKNIYIVVSVS